MLTVSADQFLLLCVAGEVIVSGSCDSTVKVWDIHTCRCLQHIAVHKDPVTAIRVWVSSKSCHAVSCSNLRSFHSIEQVSHNFHLR